jgi:hypothetical protein
MPLSWPPVPALPVFSAVSRPSVTFEIAGADPDRQGAHRTSRALMGDGAFAAGLARVYFVGFSGVAIIGRIGRSGTRRGGLLDRCA